ncbi:hypothetical protein ON010_g5052 [Phytophthora cinnamomi]|nr:hypothetical protein ON010_g5052 [Phytophthora cinnamomi]
MLYGFNLRAQLEALDLQLLDDIFQASTQAQTAETGAIEPLESYDLLEQCSAEDKRRWVELGLEAVSRGQVCALVLSGGQGTRLGFAGPKGMYDIGLPSEKSLFQLFAERLLALEALAGSKGSHAAAGRDSDSVLRYDQQDEPRDDGRVFQAARLLRAQGGSDVLLPARHATVLHHGRQVDPGERAQAGYGLGRERGRLQGTGVQWSARETAGSGRQVPARVFRGQCAQADCGNKVVWKASPDDRVGVVAKRNDRFCVIEYTEIDQEMAECVDPRTGKLVFGAANICNHFYTINFLVNVVLPNLSLEYHVAHKKIPMADDTGATYTSTTNSGIKLESFIFDVFPLSSRMAVLSVPRETEFAPVKNPPGNPVDSPDSARRMLQEEGRAWLLAAASSGSQSTDQIDSFVTEKLNKAQRIEISPLVSYNGEALEARVKSLMEGLPREIIRLESANYMATANSIPASIRRSFNAAGQDHVFRFVDTSSVTAHDACELVESLREYDPAQLAGLFERSTKADSAEKGAVDEVTPLEDGVVHQLSETAPEQKTKWLNLGLEAVSKGMVGALVLSGGQGTRLGFAGPKGIRHAESPVAHYDQRDEPRDHAVLLPRQRFFRVVKGSTSLFLPGNPAKLYRGWQVHSRDGESVSPASDGNGGIYPALKRSGLLDLLSMHKVQYLHVFSVDNMLCKVADPVFIGYCIDQDADCANKVVWKTRPEESVGVVAKRNGAYCVVEYSELDRAASEQVDPATGKLSFGAANICNHFFRLDFLQRCCNQSDAEYHVAKKKIPYVNDEGTATITPTSNTGIKLETFIFDVFPLSRSMKVLGVAREDEFAPVKNAPGSASDSPDTARQLISEQCKRWLLQAGATFADSDPDAICEVLPSLSYNGEGLEDVARLKSPIQLPVVLGRD